jgi:hypothetical protein
MTPSRYNNIAECPHISSGMGIAAAKVDHERSITRATTSANSMEKIPSRPATDLTIVRAADDRTAAHQAIKSPCAFRCGRPLTQLAHRSRRG